MRRGRRALIIAVAAAAVAAGCKEKRHITPAERDREVAVAAESTAAAERKTLPAPMVLSVSGDQHYRDSAFTVHCVPSQSEGEDLLQVEGIARGTHVNFSIYNAKEGSAPVGNYYTKRRATVRLGNLDVFVNSRAFADGGGRAQITDPFGRSGTISASNFIRMGAKKGQSHRANLAVHLSWRCE